MYIVCCPVLGIMLTMLTVVCRDTGEHVVAGDCLTIRTLSSFLLFSILYFTTWGRAWRSPRGRWRGYCYCYTLWGLMECLQEFIHNFLQWEFEWPGWLCPMWSTHSPHNWENCHCHVASRYCIIISIFIFIFIVSGPGEISVMNSIVKKR